MKWIPTSERLPSERGEYLVTVDFEGDTYVECFHYGKPIMANREVKDECFYDSDDEWGDVVYDTGTEVIAWMPLPEPYTADRKTEPKIETQIETQNSNLPFEKCEYCEYRYVRYVGVCDMCELIEDEPQTDCSWK